MRLNEEQLMVIKATREYMEREENGAYYICHAIGKVIRAFMEDGTFSPDQASQLKNQLSSGILAGISHMVTFGGFMNLTCPVIKAVHENGDGVHDPAHHNLIMMARRAWLDWIIHTGEIKPDLLAGEER